MAAKRELHLKIFKYDPSVDLEPERKIYSVPFKVGISLLDCLEYINENDEPLAFQRDCKRGLCGSCTMNLNGIPVLACRKRFAVCETGCLTVEPLTCLPLIKDLMVDFGKDLMARERFRPWLEASRFTAGLPVNLENAQFDMQYPYTLCIRCHACVEVCPAVKKIGSTFVGPLLMQDIARLSIDKRNKENRFVTAIDAGISECHDCLTRCNNVCPLGLDVYAIGVGRFKL